jgi:hypothetical protein
MAQLVEALHYKPEGHGLNLRWCHWDFSLTYSLGATLWLWGSTQPLKEMSPWDIGPGGGGVKAAGA